MTEKKQLEHNTQDNRIYEIEDNIRVVKGMIYELD